MGVVGGEIRTDPRDIRWTSLTQLIVRHVDDEIPSLTQISIPLKMEVHVATLKALSFT